MSELYLILHKVRGEPAFDIAQKLSIGDEEGWIIPTSGHRAYPHRHWRVDELADISDYPHQYPQEAADTGGLPPHLPDHCSINHEPKAILTSARDLLAKLGLAKPSPAPTRRRLT